MIAKLADMTVGRRTRNHARQRRSLTLPFIGAVTLLVVAVAVAAALKPAVAPRGRVAAGGTAGSAAPVVAVKTTSGQATDAAGLAAAGAAPVVAVRITSGEVTDAAGLAAGGAAPLVAVRTTSGEATHYVLHSGGGNCSYPGPPANRLYVALSPAEYGAAASCGSYLKVTGPRGSVQVKVVDQCPECHKGHIDLSDQAFERVAPLAAGLVRVSYHTIVNPRLSAPLSFRVQEGSSAFWLALLPIGVGNPVASLQIRTSTGRWRHLTHASYNYWIAASGMGRGPFTVRLTDTVGHQVTVHGIRLSPGIVQKTSVWMYANH
jgi:expansin (peptidoglycan-binding protein)